MALQRRYNGEVTNTQFYVAIALPAIMFLVNIVIILWSANGLKNRLDERFNTMLRCTGNGYARDPRRCKAADRQSL